MTRSSRPYQADSDLADLLALGSRARPPLRVADYPSPLDLQELLALPENRARTRLWRDEHGGLEAFGMVDHFDNALIDVVPGPDEGPLTAEILDWAAEAVRLGRAPGPVSLDASCRSDDRLRVSILKAKGFVPTGVTTLTLVRGLRDPIPEPEVPPGWRIRPAAGELEVEALVELHRAAFGTDRLSVEERLSWMRAPHYDPGLDLVLEAEAGGLAGYCMCGIEEQANAITGQRRGTTDPVAVHPQARGRGGARALLSHGLRLLRQRGMTEAVLNTSSENARMLQVAASLGYVVESERAWYSWRLA